ncbi:exonuclease V [Epithele typhae]|uniref:exonuclease V n=1 Tax=Epithele typhae TaxID=378194 RepID=UPI002008D524|nr:exonuclease V [Epithele typhae]KAH9932079.1 exonuclease V [Epithele typhae]
MTSDDEYDAFYPPLDPAALAEIEELVSHPVRSPLRPSAAPSKVPHTPSPIKPLPASASSTASSASRPPPPSPPDVEDFDDDDPFFADLTDADFAAIDACALAAIAVRAPAPLPPPPEVGRRPRATVPRAGGGGTSPGRGGGGADGHGGPRLEVALEQGARADSSPRSGPRAKGTPYQLFRGWKRPLSVTDLTAPSWCEVQFDYGLRQKRNLKMEQRPTSFTSAAGKQIEVITTVAESNERTTSRGKSIHKALELELAPDTVKVQIKSAEERWALRVINMYASFQALSEVGVCREMPVFGFVNDQLVTGIIDEVVRKPMPTLEPTRSSPSKRSASGASPASSSPHRSKRIRQDQPITSFFSSPSNASELPVFDDSPDGMPPRFALHISDTKSRTKPYLPPDEDTVASRLQLMLYHRLLSSLLATAHPHRSSSVPLDFKFLWERAGVDPAKRFSDTFIEDAGIGPATTQDLANYSTQSLVNVSCLNDLIPHWTHSIEALYIAGVDENLTLVYRLQPSTRRGKKGQRHSRRRNGDEPLTEQEAHDLAAAIQASVSDLRPGEGGEGDLAKAMFTSLSDSLASGRVADGDLGVLTHPFGPPLEATGLDGSLGGDPQLAWALQESLLAQAKEVPVLKDAIADAEASASEDPSTEESLAPVPEEVEPAPSNSTLVGSEPPKTAPSSPHAAQDEDTEIAVEDARILGKKEFVYDDAYLDSYMARVLAWWHGERAPEGVEVGLTRRCMTCEYRDGCEWREKKAQEALDQYQDHSQPAAAVSIAAEPWL